MNPQKGLSIDKFVFHFNKFFANFSAIFFVYRHDVSATAKDYASGLLRQIPRKNIERMHESVSTSSYETKHHVISDSPWSYAELNKQTAQHVSAQIGDKTAVLEIDESAFSKSGKESAGASRQYNGRLGKVDNCQVGVFAALSNEKRHALIGSRLFLPEKWTNDTKRCEKACIPASERHFKTKPQLGLDLVDEAVEAGVEFGMVAADALYGGSEFAHGLHNRDIRFTLGIHNDQQVYLNDPQPFVPYSTSPKGRRCTRPKAKHRAISVATLANGLQKHQWRRVHVRKGTKGTIKVEAAAMRVYFWNAKHSYAPVEWWLVFVRELGSEEVNYFISNAPEKTSLQSLVAKHRSRFWIERCFQDSKTSVGMADYQVRKWQAWHHHISLCMLAMAFILTLKDICHHDLPLLSCEDIITIMEFYLNKNKMTEKDLIQIIINRHKKRISAEKSALHCQKRRK